MKRNEYLHIRDDGSTVVATIEPNVINKNEKDEPVSEEYYGSQLVLAVLNDESDKPKYKEEGLYERLLTEKWKEDIDITDFTKFDKGLVFFNLVILFKDNKIIQLDCGY